MKRKWNVEWREPFSVTDWLGTSTQDICPGPELWLTLDGDPVCRLNDGDTEPEDWIISACAEAYAVGFREGTRLPTVSNELRGDWQFTWIEKWRRSSTDPYAEPEAVWELWLCLGDTPLRILADAPGGDPPEDPIPPVTPDWMRRACFEAYALGLRDGMDIKDD